MTAMAMTCWVPGQTRSGGAQPDRRSCGTLRPGRHKRIALPRWGAWGAGAGKMMGK